jgi:hypothetical protein
MEFDDLDQCKESGKSWRKITGRAGPKSDLLAVARMNPYREVRRRISFAGKSGIGDE